MHLSTVVERNGPSRLDPARFWSGFHHAVARRLLPLAVRAAAAVVPRQYWYDLALTSSGWLAQLVRATRPGLDDRSLHARLLNRVLALLSRTGKAYPIRFKVTGWELVETERARAGGEGIVFCSAHVALVKVGIARLMEAGVDLVSLAGEPGADGAIGIWGLSERLTAFKVDGNVLLKARSALRSGQSIVVMLDKGVGAQFSPNILKLVQRSAGRVIFLLTDLDERGVTQVRFLEAPDPACATDEGIQRNMQFLSEQVKRILGAKAAYGSGSPVAGQTGLAVGV